MSTKYQSFKDLPQEVTERLRDVLRKGTSSPDMPEGLPLEEIIRLRRKQHSNPAYTEKQLREITDAFVLLDRAVGRGLPNQLYEMFVKALDKELALNAHRASAVWYAHEGTEQAKQSVQDFADRTKADIEKRADWTQEQFHEEYFV